MANPPSPTVVHHRTRLPTLFEVLSRRTAAPVDLFSFYIYMRDQQRSVDYLDFWLDVSQHMSLCRHYVRELRQSVLLDTPELEKSASKRSSAVLESFDATEAGPSNSKQRATDHEVSQALRDEHDVRHHSHSNSQSSSRTRQTESAVDSPMLAEPSPGQVSSGSGQHTVARTDIRASAEKILYTYLLPGSEREIIIPQGILNTIQHAIEEETRDDPEVFDAAKDYVFQAMERDAFPGFLRSKALGNVVPPSMMARLVVGLLALFGAFWTSFILIFLDKSRRTRCWVILPFTIGIYLLASHQYMLDPIMALVGYSEYTFFNWTRVREPFVRKLLIKRAWMVLVTVAIIDAALSCLFIFVPGKRL
ncbi:regulator of G protein signaling superfamily [Trichodelitschia bisporula]|uniref:Regulator of G protein signaling superfamily n=1 Tax=Trichodelitschia bisporula TaxID=703511 RepID=A0A6G1I0W3_9PEZI|nr:regulator of G protein signaling superfamily [Trichodelitschia bisporula]